MRIATWNVNGLRARLEYLLGWLVDRQPDVVALQELKLVDDLFPHERFESAGYRAVTHGQKAWNGVAVLAKEPLELVQVGLPGQEARGARLITANVGGLNLTSIYCPNGKDVTHPDYHEKLTWYDSMIDHLARVATTGVPSVVAGDFNVCPAALDTWDESGLAGAIFHTAEERDRLNAILALGYGDLWRGLFPAAREYSWWDYRAGAFPKDQGLRIDFVLGDPSIARRLRCAVLDRDYRKKRQERTPSDHCPVWVDLD